jgi:two-component system LytT family response regulator
MDFLVKPVQILDLKSAIKKAYKQKGKNNSIEIYNTNAKQANESLKRLVLPSTDGFEIKEIKDIIQLESNDNYTWVYTTEKQKILVCRTLKEFDEMLENAGFVRIHQSHLVNEQHVVRYIKGSGGYVQLSDGTVLEVSRRKKDEFINRFMYK